MRRSNKILLTIMALLSLIVLFALTGCSSEEENDNCECLGQFGNTETGEYTYQQTDCERTPPSEEWVFIKCVDKPDY